MKETFGERLARFRRAKNLKQEEVGSALNVTAQAVSKWENDVTSPDIQTLPLLADLLGVSLDELLGRVDEPKTVVMEPSQRKDINRMMLKIIITSSDKDNVKVNIPMAIVKICLESGMQMPQVSGNNSFKNIDFSQIFALVEQGVVGKLVEIDSEDGDHIEIVCE